MARPWWALSIATKDLSKTAESVWGISVVNIKDGTKYTKYFGDPAESNLAFDNVVPWSVEGLTSLSDVGTDLLGILGDSPVFVTYNVPMWSLPLWNSMCEASEPIKEIKASMLDLQSVYYTIAVLNCKFTDTFDEPYRMFVPSKLPKKFGLTSMASVFGMSLHGERMPSDMPTAKAIMTSNIFSQLLDSKYPDDEEKSEA